ncbi:MAG: iron ABC transporter permease [Rhodobacterales bacterium]|nr:iron ABC transporter permease [Rhodobacterales bacterium]
MTDRNSQLFSAPARGALRADGWTLAALIVAALVLLPVASVLWLALGADAATFAHMLDTVLPRYLRATLLLMAGVGLLTAAVGTGAAWLVTMYRFPLSRALSVGLMFPLAIPAYVGAYALVDFLQYAGPVQSLLRDAMGWTTRRDYWFPEIRSPGAAIVVLSAALYPYVFILARAAFREQSGNAYEVARALGAGPWGVFWRVGLPLARPAVAAGVALAMMETVNDYGTIDYFGVQTLTAGIFSVWLTNGDVGGAAQLALIGLALVLALVGVERAGRRALRHHQLTRSARPVSPVPLGGWRAGLATAACVVPFVLGFVLPVAVMGWHALRVPSAWAAPGLGRALIHSLVTGGLAAALAVTGALFLVYGVRLARRAVLRAVLPLTVLGYAAPGAVLAVGLLVPLAALDHRLADGVLALTGADPGLMITGTAAALVIAYVVRFFGIAQGAVDSAFGRVSPNLPLAARSLGRGPGGVLAAVYLPLMRRSVAMAALVVFVDCLKELPATLLLRPFNYDTLATRVHEQASLERLEQAAPAALLVMAVGLVAVLAMARNRD